eukprot:3219045-Alexandrium_andersonii.AAC.1
METLSSENAVESRVAQLTLAMFPIVAIVGRLIASVPESEIMDDYYTIKALVPETTPAYLVST